MRIIIILLTVLIANVTQAQPLSYQKRTGLSMNIFLNGGVLSHFNHKDLETPATGFLKVQNTTGYKAGIEMVFIPRKKAPVLLNLGLEYRFQPHRYRLQYGSSASGLTADAVHEMKFGVNSVALRIAPGYAFRLSESSHIDVAVGFLFDAAVRADLTNKEEGLYVSDDKTGYNQIAAYRFTGHGVKGDGSLLTGSDMGLNIMYFASASYRLHVGLLGKRAMRIGIEYAKTAAGNRVSKTSVLYMDKNRNVIARDRVEDKGTCLTVFAGISI